MLKSVGGAVGLRERKKQRTRAQLMDAALRLCLELGYENATVEQIAAAADVSPRTFSRYFPTKDAVVVALLEDLVDAVAREIVEIPAEVSPLEAMRRAHVTVLNDVAAGRLPELPRERVAMTLRLINSSPELQTAAVAVQDEDVLGTLARKHMGLDLSDRRSQLVRWLWASLVLTAWGDLNGIDGQEPGPELLVRRLEETFADFYSVTADPSGGDGRHC